MGWGHTVCCLEDQYLFVGACLCMLRSGTWETIPTPYISSPQCSLCMQDPWLPEACAQEVVDTSAIGHEIAANSCHNNPKLRRASHDCKCHGQADRIV